MNARASDFALAVQDGLPTVRVTGDVDAYNMDSLKAVLEVAEETGCGAIVVVLDDAGYICARAYAMLSAFYKRLQETQRRLYVVCAQQFCVRIMLLLEVPFPVLRSVDAVRLSERGEARRDGHP